MNSCKILLNLDMTLSNINFTIGSDGAGGTVDSVAKVFDAFGFPTGFNLELLGSGSKSSFAYNGSGSFAWFRTGSGGTKIEGGMAFTPMEGARTLADPPRLKISMSSSLSSESSPAPPDIEF